MVIKSRENYVFKVYLPNLTELCHYVKFNILRIEVLKVEKKEEVIKILGPIAKVLEIELDYVIDHENKREYLVCNNTKICTNGTSVFGIREEFFGYVFLNEWKHRSLGPFEIQTKNHIKQYWFDNNFNQPYLSRRF